MSSGIKFIKTFLSGNTPQGIKFRTVLSIVLTVSIIVIEFAVYYTHWNSIPDMIKYDYDFAGLPHDVFAKQWIWYNLLLQIFICALVFIIKYLSYKIRRIHRIVYDKNNKLVPIINKRFSMFAWETAMLFVTTEQGYIFALIDIIKDRTCDTILTVTFLFWLIILVMEFRSDIKVLKVRSENN